MMRYRGGLCGLALILTACGDASGPVEPRDEALYSRGQAVFIRYCGSCHVAEGRSHREGPYLSNLAGRKAGAVSGFDFSDAMKGYGQPWTPESLDGYLAAPEAFIPGNNMMIEPVSDAGERAAVIYYLMRN